MADIIVIGSSMGGVPALRTLVAGLPADLPAAVFIVQHTGPSAQFHLPDILNRSGPLDCQAAIDGDSIQHGRILVGPPDFQLLLKPDRVLLTRGAHENRSRPAIDALFRSAAVAHGPRVVGVVLTGFLDDGSAGLFAIKRCGGITVVQDPETAEYADMPRFAREHVDPHYVLTLEQIPALLARLSREPVGPPLPVPEDLAFEVRMAEGQLGDEESREAAGDPSPFACPDCGGVLWQVEDEKMLRFRCRTGHSYTAASLLNEQDVHLESAIWAAIRALEERTQLLAKLARDAEASGLLRPAKSYEERSQTSLEHSRILRELLFQRRPQRAAVTSPQA